MGGSADSCTPLYSYHPYKKISSNPTNRITGRGSTVSHSQQPKEVGDLTSLLFGKEFTGGGCAGSVIDHPGPNVSTL